MNKSNEQIDLTGRILTHEELASQPERGMSGNNNALFFQRDFKAHLLDKYKGTAVLYWKGILCGQGVDAINLLKEASRYYGKSNLNVFKVPNSAEELDKGISDANSQEDDDGFFLDARYYGFP